MRFSASNLDNLVPGALVIKDVKPLRLVLIVSAIEAKGAVRAFAPRIDFLFDRQSQGVRRPTSHRYYRLRELRKLDSRWARHHHDIVVI